MKIVVSLHRVNMKRYPSVLVSEILFGCLTGNFLKKFVKCLHDKIKCCIFASHLGSDEPKV